MLKTPDCPRVPKKRREKKGVQTGMSELDEH